MPIKAKFSKADIKKMVQSQVEAMELAIINRLIFVGETFVKNARENGTYNDITGNLRSSVAYIVLKDGRKLKDNFEKSAKGTDKQKGINEAKSLIDKLKDNFKTGYTLIVVAGMEYAAAVESKGKDVITGSSLIAKQQLVSLFKK